MAIAPRVRSSPAAAQGGVEAARGSTQEERAAVVLHRGHGRGDLPAGEGQSLRTICKAPGMPDKETIANWLRRYREFDKQYQDARCDQADMHVEEMLDVARLAKNAKSSEEAQGYRLLVDTLKWRASKVKPRSYGDHAQCGGQRAADDRRATERAARILARAPPRRCSGRAPRVDLPRYRTSCSSFPPPFQVVAGRVDELRRTPPPYSARPARRRRRFSTKPEPLLKMPGGWAPWTTDGLTEPPERGTLAGHSSARIGSYPQPTTVKRRV
jgi:hypothetical protein